MGQQKPDRRQRNAEKTCQNVGEGEVKDKHTSAGLDLGLPDDHVDKEGVSEEAEQYDQCKQHDEKGFQRLAELVVEVKFIGYFGELGQRVVLCVEYTMF